MSTLTSKAFVLKNPRFRRFRRLTVGSPPRARGKQEDSMSKYLTAFAKRGINVHYLDGELTLTPMEKITPKMQAHIDEHIAEIIAEMESDDTSIDIVGPPPKPYHLIASRLLCDTIAIGRDWPREYVGYTWAEVESLRGAAPELLKAVHEVKRKFPGASVENKDGIWYEQAQRNMEAI